MGGENLDGYENNNRHCIVVGNEANGVSDFVKQNATKIVGIPMLEKSESLNVAVASAIMMYKLKKL
jgi:TrmH family RNA methyltransferase